MYSKLDRPWACTGTVSLQILTGSKASSSHGKQGVDSTAKCSEAQTWKHQDLGQGRNTNSHLLRECSHQQVRDPFLQRKNHRTEARLSGGSRLPVRCWFSAAIPEWVTGVELDWESQLLTVARALKGLASS